MNALRALRDHGQSVWLDYIRRTLILSGELRRLIDQDGLRGVTSNPSIFEKAITSSTDYTNSLKALQRNHRSPMEVYEQIAVRDIQDAADVMWPVYEQTNGRDGYVSLEVSPYLAHEKQKTIAEALRLYNLVSRDNVLIKVPATPEGIEAIRELIAQGLSINVTLLFSRSAYAAVAEAYISGLEQLVARGGDPARVASVASFFVSRIDTKIDGLLTARAKAGGADADRLRSLSGRAAIANAKLAYQDYKKIFSGDRWRTLEGKGARTQRLLWASTSTKNPSYRDVIYVEELIGPDTVNTIPPSTFDAFRDHGRVERTLDADIDEAENTVAQLEHYGISLETVGQELLREGVTLFSEAFDKLLSALKEKQAQPVAATIHDFEYSLPDPLKAAVGETIEEWRAGDYMRRLWSGDASLWTNSDEDNWLGWLRVTERRIPHLEALSTAAQQIRDAGFTDAVLLGMGGSSLTPEVFKKTFGRKAGWPELHVLDSTDPDQITSLERRINLKRTLFIVSSKSGSTLEPNILQEYFYSRVSQAVGGDTAGDHFVAVTDPGSKVQRVAEERNFRHIFPGVPSIGGRYSALSNFGLVPAAIMGVNLADFLDRTEHMVHACSPSVPVNENPGAVLGAILGTLGKRGIDKITVVSSPGLSDLGAWLEQLLAESTGKQGRGLVPVDREHLGPAEVYNKDRLIVYVRLKSAPDSGQDTAIAALEKAGLPVVRIHVPQPEDLGQEFFRWEIATAVAGAVIGINPFNQPDVEAAKVVARELAAEYERTGHLPAEVASVEQRGVALFAPNTARRERGSLTEALREHLDQLRDGDYFALLAFVEMNKANEERLQAIRHLVRDRRRVATCLGFGPRFLHSTGQAYKGGPNTGVFLQITTDHASNIAVPGKNYTFGVIQEAQARGDFQVLASRGRRVLRAHLKDVESGLQTLHSAIVDALGQLRQAA